MEIYGYEFWLVGHFVASDEHTSNSNDDLFSHRCDERWWRWWCKRLANRMHCMCVCVCVFLHSNKDDSLRVKIGTAFVNCKKVKRFWPLDIAKHINVVKCMHSILFYAQYVWNVLFKSLSLLTYNLYYRMSIKKNYLMNKSNNKKCRWNCIFLCFVKQQFLNLF